METNYYKGWSPIKEGGGGENDSVASPENGPNQFWLPGYFRFAIAH